MRHVVFARPDQLHGFANCLGNLYCLHDEVDVDTPAESATQKSSVYVHFVFCEAGDLHRYTFGQLRKLRWAIDVAAVFSYIGRKVHRLHGGVRQERKLVTCFYCFGSTSHRLIDVTGFLQRCRRFCQRVFEPL